MERRLLARVPVDPVVRPTPDPSPGVPLSWEPLRRRLTGRLVLRQEADHRRAAQLQSAQFDGVVPAAVAYCASVGDVADCVRFAQHHGLRLTPRTGGHSVAGYSTSDGLVVDLTRMNRVRVGPRAVRLGGGAQAVDVAAALRPHALTAPSGTCPTVGVSGFLLGGGYGPQSRKYGMACDRLLAADLVLADGRSVRASETENPDLFWALRGGGGGNFGVVTALEVRPARVPTMVVYDVYWDYSDALDVLDAWQRWVPGTPGELSSRAWVAGLGDAPVPPQLMVHGAFLGDRAACERHLAELTAAVGKPFTSRLVEELPYTEAMMRIYGCSGLSVAQAHRVGHSPDAQLPRDNHITTANRFLTRPLPRPALAQALTAFESERHEGQFRIFGLYAFGGAVNAVPRTATAYVHRDASLSAFSSLSLTHPVHTGADRTAARRWVDRCVGTVTPHSNGESFQNFIDPTLPDWQRAYYAENYPRLREVRKKYDPYAFFRFPQGIE